MSAVKKACIWAGVVAPVDDDARGGQRLRVAASLVTQRIMLGRQDDGVWQRRASTDGSARSGATSGFVRSAASGTVAAHQPLHRITGQRHLVGRLPVGRTVRVRVG